MSIQVKGKFGTYVVGHNEAGEYATLGYKGATFPFSKKDVALVFRELHALLYTTESNNEQ